MEVKFCRRCYRYLEPWRREDAALVGEAVGDGV